MCLQKENHLFKPSEDGSQAEPPVSNPNWANRFFMASLTLIGISLGALLKDIIGPPWQTRQQHNKQDHIDALIKKVLHFYHK